MKNTNSNLFIVLVIGASMLAMFSVSGCGEQPVATENRTVTGPIGGTDGLKVTFADNMPKSIAAGQSFDIVVMLRNLGETPIDKQAARIYLSEADYSTHNLRDKTWKKNMNYLAGRMRSGTTITPGGLEPVIFRGASVSPEHYVQGGGTDQIRVNICYPYKSSATMKVCLGAENIFSESAGSECDPYVIKELRNSGAPIQITKVTPSPGAEGTYLFLIEAKRAGKGDLVKDTVTCDIEEGANIEVPVSLRGGWIQKQDCSTMQFSVMGGMGTATCEVQGPMGLDRNELNNMIIEVGEYSYRDSASTNINVVVAPNIGRTKVERPNIRQQ